jgi:hypothetical protein
MSIHHTLLYGLCRMWLELSNIDFISSNHMNNMTQIYLFVDVISNGFCPTMVLAGANLWQHYLESSYFQTILAIS